MQVSNNTTNTFGKVIVAPKAQEALGYAMHSKVVEGKTTIVKHFRDLLAKCEDSKYADLVITNGKNVFIQDKVSGHFKQINSFKELFNNALSGLKHVLLAEESKIHF